MLDILCPKCGNRVLTKEYHLPTHMCYKIEKGKLYTCLDQSMHGVEHLHYLCDCGFDFATKPWARLAPCKNCNAQDVLIMTYSNIFIVRCMDCGKELRDTGSCETLIKQWNKENYTL